ncbi:MAG: response regulator [Ktedonobacteraceae bacterium]
MDTAPILLVDDDLALLQALPRMLSLRMSGIEVQTAESAQVALTMIEQHEYDAIVSDIKMPGMDGLDLLAKVQEHHPETPVVLITGHGDHELAIQALRGGAYDYLLKPIDRDDFIAALSRALHTRQLRRQIEVQQRALERHALSLEQQVEHLTHELVASNAANDAMLSMVTHQLAPPLMSLRDTTQLFNAQLQRADGIEKVRRDLVKVERDLRQMEVLYQDLQDTSLIRTNHLSLHCTSSNLVELCCSVVDEYLASTGVAPTFEACDDHLQAEVDPERISQALLHLLSNAYKYSPERASITVTLQRSGREAIISVHDQGPGIAAEQLPHIWEQFYCVPGHEVQSSSSAGLGLGLYIARTIVEQHGGRLEVQSQAGHGSTFSIVLPLAAGRDLGADENQ